MTEIPLPSPPAGIDLAADQGHRIISSMIALIILPTIFVIVRFVSRKVSRAGFWWDDYLIVAAQLFCYGPCISVIISQRVNGFGRHLWALDDPAKSTSTFLKILYIYIIFHYCAVICIKFAILTFYGRIFPATKLRITLYLAHFVVAGFGIGALMTTIFQCQPIHSYWDRLIPSHCISGEKVLIIPGAINSVLDFFVFALPFPLLWKLRATRHQKWVLTGIFACAGFVCIISIVRLVALFRLVVVSPLSQFDLTWNYVTVAIWTAAEPCTGIIAACIPSLRPLLSLLLRGTTRAPGTTSLHSRSAPSTTSSHTIYHHGDEFELLSPPYGSARLGDGDRVQPGRSPRWGHETEVRGGRGPKKATGFGGLGARQDDVSTEELVPQVGIRVQKEVLVISEEWEWKDRLF